MPKFTACQDAPPQDVTFTHVSWRRKERKKLAVSDVSVSPSHASRIGPDRQTPKLQSLHLSVDGFPDTKTKDMQ